MSALLKVDPMYYYEVTKPRWIIDRDEEEAEWLSKMAKFVKQEESKLKKHVSDGMDSPEDYGYDDSLEWLWEHGDGDGKMTAIIKNNERVFGQERYIGMRDIYDCGAPWRDLV